MRHRWINSVPKFLSLALSLSALMAAVEGAVLAASPPKFDEVLQIIRTNLGGMSSAEIERAALKALLTHFDGQVILEDNPGSTPARVSGPSVSKSTLLDGGYGYVRVSHVSSKLDESIAAEFEKLGGIKNLRGLLLDLRYAGGTDQKAAARTADRFLASERVLLTVEGETLRASAKTNAIQLPTAIIVNRQTSGAAEVLAALLRQNQVGLLIGSGTTGGVRQFKDFTLSTGQRLRIATGETKLGDGQAIPSAGLRPDITVTVGADEERAFFAEPNRTIGASAISKPAGQGKDSPARLNEAELIRRMKEGQSPDASPVVTTPSVSAPQVRDPALARALDLLKGLSVVRQPRNP